MSENTLAILKQVPPSQLQKKGVSLSRCVQTAREFVVVFPSVTYSSVSLGHNMAESVHYGTQDWITDGYLAAQVSCLLVLKGIAPFHLCCCSQ